MKRTRLSLRSAAIFPDIYGAEEESKSSESGAQEDAKDSTKSNESKESDSLDDEDGKDESGDPSRKISALKEEKDRHYNARKAAEKELEELRKWREEQERKDKSDLENANSDLETERKARQEAEAKFQDLAIKYAFRSLDGIEFHNPERAIKLLDLSNVSVEDGQVDMKALKAAAKRLADEEPYLVKTKKDKQEEKPPPRSGNPPHGSTPAQGEVDKNKLQKKYPALRGR